MSDGLLDELRGRFRETSRDRLLTMSALLDELQRDPADGDALQQLGKHFHGLAGMGGTYGFPRVSALADDAEAAILLLVRSARAPGPEQVVQWRGLLGEIERDLTEGNARYTVWLVQSDDALAARIGEALAREEIAVRRIAGSIAASGLGAALPDAVIVEADAGNVLDELQARGYRGGTIVTGEDEFADKVRALRSGADAVIGKPLDVAALVRRVTALRERKERPPSCAS